MKFSTKLILLFSGILLAAFLIAGYASYLSETSVLETQLRDKLELQAFHAMDKLDRMLYVLQSHLRVITADPVIGSRGSTPSEIAERLRSFGSVHKIVLSLSFFDMRRVRIADTQGKQIGRRHSFSEYWPAIRDGKERVVTIVNSEALGRPVLYAAAIVRDKGGAPIGVVAARMALETLAEIIYGAFPGGAGGQAQKFELLDANGLILFSSYNEAGILRETSEDWAYLRGALSAAKTIGSDRHVFQGEDEVSAFAVEQGYQDYAGEGWVLTMCTPVKVAFAPVSEHGLRRLKLFAAIGSLALLAVVVFSRTVTRPLKELRSAAASIGKGNLDVTVAVRSNDEIGQLATAFNDMVRGLRESENRFRSLFESATDYIHVLDRNGVILQTNPAAVRDSGYREDELVGRSIAEFFSSASQAIFAAQFPLLLQRGNNRQEVEFVRKDGRRTTVDCSASAIRDESGAVKSFVVFQRDITERKQIEDKINKLNEELEEKVRERTKQLLDAQEELVRKEKLSTLGQIAGSVGHELRNPLGVMNNAVYYLQAVLTNAEPTVREYLEIIKSEIAGSERIVSELLDAVRTKPSRLLPVPAGDLIAMSLERCPVPDRVTLAVERRTERAVLADPLQMKQTFINLVNNAVDAMPKGGRLEIAAEDDGDERVRFTFRDTGTGISPEHRSRLFLPLFTTKARGIGLGLAVVKNLTEANGGTVAVESAPGAGTTFTILLPVAT